MQEMRQPQPTPQNTDEKKPPKTAAVSQPVGLLVCQVQMELASFLDELDQGIDSLAHDELSMDSRDALQAMDSTHLKYCHSRLNQRV